MKNRYLKYGLLLIAFLMVPIINYAITFHIVTLSYVDANTNRVLHTTYVKNIEQGNTFNVKEYEYNLKNSFGIHGYSDSPKEIILDGSVLKNKNVTVQKNLFIKLLYEPKNVKYVSRTHLVKKDSSGKIVSIENMSSTGELDFSGSEIKVKPKASADLQNNGKYLGYFVTYDTFGEVSTSTINNLTLKDEAVVKKSNDFTFVCIDFIYEKTLEDIHDVVKKSAKWTDEEKDEAEITIEVTPKKLPVAKKIDILLIFDESSSAASWSNLSDPCVLGKGDGIFAKYMKSAIVSSPDEEQEATGDNNTVSMLAFNARAFNFYGFKNGKVTSFNKQVNTAIRHHDNTDGTFFSPPFTSAKDYFDNLYKSKKVDSRFDRHPYLIIVTDGIQSTHNSSDLDSMVNCASYLRRTYGVEIYVIAIPDEWSNFSRSWRIDYDDITGASGYNLPSHQKAGTVTNTNKYVSIVRDRSEQGISHSMEDAVEYIISQIEIHSPQTAKYVLEDNINAEIFDTSNGKITAECYVNNVKNAQLTRKIEISRNKVSLDFSDYMKQNVNINSVKIVVNVKLKEKYKHETLYINTNEIGNDGADTKCTYTYPNGKNTVVSPWLPRDEEPGSININVLLVDDRTGMVKKVIYEGSVTASLNEQYSVNYKKLKTGDISSYEYKGYEVVDGLLEGKDIKEIDVNRFKSENVDHLIFRDTATTTLSEESVQKTINFYLTSITPKVKLLIKHRILNKTGISGVYWESEIPGIGTSLDEINENIYQGDKVIASPIFDIVSPTENRAYNFDKKYKLVDYNSNSDKSKVSGQVNSSDLRTTTGNVEIEMNKSKEITFYYVPGEIKQKVNLLVRHVVVYADGKEEERIRKENQFDHGAQYKETKDKELSTKYAYSKCEVKKSGMLVSTLKTSPAIGTLNEDTEIIFYYTPPTLWIRDRYRETKSVDKFIYTDDRETVENLQFGEYSNAYEKLQKPRTGYSYVTYKVHYQNQKIQYKDNNGKISVLMSSNVYIDFIYEPDTKLKVQYRLWEPTQQRFGKTIFYVDNLIPEINNSLDETINGNVARAKDSIISPDNSKTYVFVNKYRILNDKTTYTPNDLIEYPNDTDGVVTVNENNKVVVFYYKEQEPDKLHLDVIYLLEDKDGNRTPLSNYVSGYNNYTIEDIEIGEKVENIPLMPDNETYELSRYFVNNSENTIDSFEDHLDVTMMVSDTLTIIYTLIEPPEVKEPSGDIEIIPSGDPMYGDEVSNPDDKYNGKLIILDETFKLNIRISNVPSGDVKVTFPFDVYHNPNGRLTGNNGRFQEANKELDLGHIETDGGETLLTYYFRLPSWIIEKIPVLTATNKVSSENSYKVDVRIVSNSETVFNQSTYIGVIGKLYDFTITNVFEGENNTNWASMLFAKGNLGREYKADTIPIAQDEIYPNISEITDVNAEERVNKTKPRNWNRGLLLGGRFLFTINTKGLKSETIRIIPKLTYYDAKGELVEDVRFKYGDMNSYFADSDGLVYSVGTHFTTALNDRLRATDELRKETAKTIVMMAINENFNVTDANILNFRSLVNQYKMPEFTTKFDFGTYGGLLIPNSLRLPYVNYTSNDLYKSEVNKIGGFIDTAANRPDDSKGILRYSKYGYTNSENNGEYLNDIASIGMDEYKLINSLGHWYAEYSIPSSLKVVDKDNKVLKGGSIIVSFKISTLDESNATYINYKDVQWKKENTAIDNIGSGKIVKIELPNVKKQVDFDISSGYYPVAIYSTDSIELVVSGGTH